MGRTTFRVKCKGQYAGRWLKLRGAAIASYQNGAIAGCGVNVRFRFSENWSAEEGLIFAASHIEQVCKFASNFLSRGSVGDRDAACVEP